MKNNKSLFSIMVLILLSLTLVLGAQESRSEQWGNQGFEVPKDTLSAPDFTLQDLEGKGHSLSDLKGTVVFLNFWATWCPPCRAEMPSMQAINEELGDENFTMVGINLQEDKGTVEEFLKNNGYTFPIWLDTNGRVGSGIYGVQGIPTTYIIDKEGLIVARLVGTREWNTPEFKGLLRDLINS